MCERVFCEYDTVCVRERESSVSMIVSVRVRDLCEDDTVCV